MIVSGSLTQSSDGKVVPSEGDTLALINQTTLATEATATVGSSSSYAAIISKPATFNKTVLIFRLTHSGKVYKMYYSGGGEAAFAFNGALLPSQTVLNLVALTVSQKRDKMVASGGFTVTQSSMLHVRVDKDIKSQAGEALATMGLSVSDAVRLFLKRVVNDQAFPLELKVPNAASRTAIEESRAMMKARRAHFETAAALFDDLEKAG
jgi:DNA-damage-inducible protein J